MILSRVGHFQCAMATIYYVYNVFLAIKITPLVALIFVLMVYVCMYTTVYSRVGNFQCAMATIYYVYNVFLPIKITPLVALIFVLMVYVCMYTTVLPLPKKVLCSHACFQLCWHNKIACTGNETN